MPNRWIIKCDQREAWYADWFADHYLTREVEFDLSVVCKHVDDSAFNLGLSIVEITEGSDE